VLSKQVYIGLMQNFAQLGDVVFIMSGVSVPFIVCEDDDEKFQLVGEAYIHGIMEGEAFQDGPGDGRMETTITMK
jgi:hypothetical protein